jgi:hypothetical protein
MLRVFLHRPPTYRVQCEDLDEQAGNGTDDSITANSGSDTLTGPRRLSEMGACYRGDPGAQAQAIAPALIPQLMRSTIPAAEHH